MDKVLHKLSEKELKKIGKASIERVKKEFSNVKMAERLDSIIDEMATAERKSVDVLKAFVLTIGIVIADVAYYSASQNPSMKKKLANILLPPFALSGLSLAFWVGYLIFGGKR